MPADWSRLTAYLTVAPDDCTLSWEAFGEIVGGVPASAVSHPQWWRGDRPNTRAWRKAGFEVSVVRPGESVRFSRVDAAAPGAEAASSRALESHATNDAKATARRSFAASPGRDAGLDLLSRADPGSALVVIPCSSRKRSGGQRSSGSPTSDTWPTSLLRARDALARTAGTDESRLLPAWCRYDGWLYGQAAEAIQALAHSGRLLILSGGYGLLEGDEPIGMYNRLLKERDWPAGLLRGLLAERAEAAGRDVVIFAARTSSYASVARDVRWQLPPEKTALMVGVDGVRGGAAREVPRRLGQALAAWWDGSVEFPDGITVTVLA